MHKALDDEIPFYFYIYDYVDELDLAGLKKKASTRCKDE
jgi:hypothetical protein